jgi:hypothetical protein
LRNAAVVNSERASYSFPLLVRAWVDVEPRLVSNAL